MRLEHHYCRKFIHVIVFLVVCLLCSSCHLFKKEKSKAITSPLKEILILEESTDLENRFDPDKLKDKIVFINFWASWCGPCQEEMPSLLKLASERSKDMILISLNVDNSQKEMKKFMSLFPNFKGENIYIFYDGDRRWTQAYSVTGFPETFIYDRNHKFIKRIQGAVNFKGNEFSKLILDFFKK